MHSNVTAQEQQSWTSLLSQPDTLATAQYLDRWRHQRNQDPEKMLMYAVLEDAISCYQKYSSAARPRSKALFKDVDNWLMHEKSNWPFSFERICEVLDLNPDYIRAGLLRWRSSAAAPPAKLRLFYVVRNGRRARKAT